MSQTVETKVEFIGSAPIGDQVDSVFEGGDDLIAGIPGDQLVRRAIARRLVRDINGGVVSKVDAFNVGEGESGKMLVAAQISSTVGVVARSLFIDERYRGDYGSPELCEECNSALGAIAISHDEYGVSYYDSDFFHSRW